MDIVEIKGSTIFAVDDNKENLKVLEQYLMDFELKVVPLRSGEEILNLIHKRIPDLILLDIMMPGGIDGYETCRRLKADEITKDIPVIFMSALTETIDKVTGFNLGAVDYITKPIETDELLSRVHTHLSISRLQIELFEMNSKLEEKVLIRTEELRKSNVQLKNEIAERKRAEIELQERAARLELIADMGRRTTAILELQELLQQTVNLVQKTFEYYNVIIFLVDGNHLLLKATGMPQEQQMINKVKLRIGIDGISGWVAKNGNSLCVPDVSTDERYYSEIDGTKTKSELAVPIKLKETVIGVLDVQSVRLDDFKKIDDFTLQTIGDQLAIAIENAKLYQEAHEEIAERKLAEEALRKSENKFRQLFMNLPDAIFVCRIGGDNPGEIINVNPVSERQTGYSRDELIGMNIVDDLGVEKIEIKQLQNRERELLKKNTILFNEKKKRKDGSEYWTEVLISTIELGKEKVSLSVNRDITQQKKANEEILKLSQSIKQSPALIIITDLEGNIEYINSKFTQVTGYSFDEVKGQIPRILKAGAIPKEEYETLWSTIKAGKEWRGEVHNKKKNGEWYWESVIISSIKNEKGEMTHYLAVKEDITEFKQLQQQFHQSQKMESIGALAGGIAHDFNNLLTVINGHADLSMMKIDEDNLLYGDVLAIKQAGKRATNLTRQLLAFSRKQVYTPIILEINQVISDLEKMIHRLIGENIKIKMILKPDINRIKADPGQIEQILINLIVNARDAINDHTEITSQKKITIETKNVFLDESYVSEHHGCQVGAHVSISVSDTGTGMDEETKNKIFEPFFTTKEEGKGTGLGLSTVYGIVKQNHGSIYIYTEKGIGTTFKIYWPGSDQEIQDKIDKHDEEKILKGSESILIVEDNSEVSDIALESLQTLGYTTHVSSNGEEAILFLKEKDFQVDLIISDVVMPKMGGKELLDKLKEMNQNLKFIFASGYTDNHIAHNGQLMEGFDFLQKPYSIKSLAQKVREVLDA